MLFSRFLLASILLIINQHGSDGVKYRIKLAEYNYTFIPQGRCSDTLVGNIEGSKFIKIFLFDCKGKMNVECFNKDSILLEKGSYINSLDLLKSYYYASDASRSKTTVKIISYYQPLRDGIWYFYDEKGKLVLNKMYEKGIAIDSAAAK